MVADARVRCAEAALARMRDPICAWMNDLEDSARQRQRAACADAAVQRMVLQSPRRCDPPRDARPLRESARHWHPVWWRLSRNCGLAHHGTRPPDAVRGVRRSPWIRSGARASPGDTWTRGQLYRSRRSTRGSTALRWLVSARRRWLLRTVRRCIRIYYTSIVIYLASLRIARKLVTVAPPSADLKQLALGIPPHTRAPRAAPHACR